MAAVTIEGVGVVDPSQIGVVGLCVLVMVALARGWLVTRREANDIRHDRDEWRSESRLKDVQLAEKDKQLDHLEEVGVAVNAVMRAIQKGAAPDHEVPS